MGVLAGGGIGREAAALGAGRRRVEVGGDRAEPAPGGVHWGLLLVLPCHGDGWTELSWRDPTLSLSVA